MATNAERLTALEEKVDELAGAFAALREDIDALEPLFEDLAAQIEEAAQVQIVPQVDVRRRERKEAPSAFQDRQQANREKARKRLAEETEG